MFDKWYLDWSNIHRLVMMLELKKETMLEELKVIDLILLDDMLDAEWLAEMLLDLLFEQLDFACIHHIEKKTFRGSRYYPNHKHHTNPKAQHNSKMLIDKGFQAANFE